MKIGDVTIRAWSESTAALALAREVLCLRVWSGGHPRDPGDGMDEMALVYLLRKQTSTKSRL